MKRLRKIILYILGFLLLALLIGPFLIPIPPLENTLPPAQLADPDSQFIEINGLTVHYKEIGSGETVFLLLHGFAASEFSWREVMEPLAAYGRVIAFDRPAFGLTDRPLAWEGTNPYSAEGQIALTLGLMDALGVEKAILVGNSAGGTLSLALALAHPERVSALVLVDAAVYAGGGAPAWVRPLFSTPQMQRVGPLFVRGIQNWGIDFAKSAWHDPSKISEDVWVGYTKPLQVENWDKGLWLLTTASEESDLAERMDEITFPTLVVTGDDDRIVPTEQSIRLSEEIPGAYLYIVPNCGHVPHEECPKVFLEAVSEFLATMGVSVR
ncbi:MAG: alpha/beta hydrolase [Anaerolineales bacterium]|nr:alpha/beta hydrolase [Anaerolineales bacterium]